MSITKPGLSAEATNRRHNARVGSIRPDYHSACQAQAPGPMWCRSASRQIQMPPVLLGSTSAITPEGANVAATVLAGGIALGAFAVVWPQAASDRKTTPIRRPRDTPILMLPSNGPQDRTTRSPPTDTAGVLTLLPDVVVLLQSRSYLPTPASRARRP